jgi:hypothetical protein
MVSWFGPQNQAGYGLSIAPQNRQEDEDDAGHVSRSSGLFRLEVSQAMVSQFGLKIGRGTMRMVHVESSRKLHQVEAKNGRVDAMGCVGPYYPNFAILYVLCTRGILVF